MCLCGDSPALPGLALGRKTTRIIIDGLKVGCQFQYFMNSFSERTSSKSIRLEMYKSQCARYNR